MCPAKKHSFDDDEYNLIIQIMRAADISRPAFFPSFTMYPAISSAPQASAFRVLCTGGGGKNHSETIYYRG